MVFLAGDGEQNRVTMNKKTLLCLAVAAAATFASFAQAQPVPDAPAARPAAAAASAASNRTVRAPAARPAPIPRLDLKIPATPEVMCACVRASGRA